MSFELDPIRRIHVMAASIPGAAVAEGVLDAPADTIHAEVRPGWCWMQSPLAVAAMAAVPEGERTRFAHLEAMRVPGARLMGPFLGLKMKLARELRRFERQAQLRVGG